jgi:hypothetical protein
MNDKLKTYLVNRLTKVGSFSDVFSFNYNISKELETYLNRRGIYIERILFDGNWSTHVYRD